MRCATGLMGMAGRAAALALLVQPLAGVEAQGTGAGATPDPGKESQARLCVNAYNSLLKADSRFVADNRAAIDKRRQALSKKFGIAAPAITPDGSRIGEFLADFTSAQISDCENQFADMSAFQPRIHAGRGLLMAPAAATPPAPPPASPSDLACGSIFWVAGLAWPQEREGWLGYANRAVAQHLAATPKDTRAQAEARVMADGQARARLLQQGGAEPEKFKRDLTICANQFGIPSNTPTPAAAPAQSAAPARAAPASTAPQKPSALVVPWGVSDKPAGNDPKFCMIWAGKTQPMFNFSVYENDARRIPKLLMSAPWLRGQADRSPVDVKVEFPDGTRWETRGVYVVERDLTVTVMPALDELYRKLSRPGVISLDIGGTNKRFQVPNLDVVPPAMQSCIAALPAAAAS